VVDSLVLDWAVDMPELLDTQVAGTVVGRLHPPGVRSFPGTLACRPRRGPGAAPD
jgi:hypothetical protein